MDQEELDNLMERQIEHAEAHGWRKWRDIQVQRDLPLKCDNCANLIVVFEDHFVKEFRCHSLKKVITQEVEDNINCYYSHFEINSTDTSGLGTGDISTGSYYL